MILRAACLALAVLFLPLQSARAAGCDPSVALLSGAGRQTSFRVEMADDPQERALGLMFRRELGRGYGMLFLYENPQPVSFWMRNTLIPLDILFFDARGELRHIHPMARPLDETPIPGAVAGDPAPQRLMVLEIAGGEAARLGLVPGMALSHPALPQNTALAPCR